MRRLSLRIVYVVVLSAITVAGCSRRGARPVDGGRPEAGRTSSEAPAETGVVGELAVAPVSPAQLGAAISKYRGKVLLIDYWATWCEPCKEFFPHTVALSRELGDRGLAVVSLSLDDAEDEPEVRRFLTANRATFENLRARTGASPESATAFGIENGAIPFLQLYDRTGKLRKTFPAPVKPNDVEKAVRQLLSEPASAA